MTGPLVERMIGAARLDVATYEAVEADVDATAQAAAVVAMVAVAQAVGSSALGPVGAMSAAGAALIGWLVWAGITFLIGQKVFGGEATWGEVMRTLGFAQAPGILWLLAFLPVIGWFLDLLLPLWIAVAGFIGIRQALDLDNLQTLLTVISGWFIYAALSLLF
jgi:hypothetical protein